MDSYLLMKFFHILGVIAFMGGTCSSFILIAISQKQQADVALHLLKAAKTLDRTIIFYGGLTLLLAGLSAALIPDSGVYHAYWVLTGFSIFVAQSTLAIIAAKLVKYAVHSKQPRFASKTALLLQGVTVSLGILVIFMMVTKYSP